MSAIKGKNNSGINNGIPLLISILFFMLSLQLSAQEPPPRPIQVTVDKDLGFGAFTHGAVGGTVTVSSAGIRTSTGDVILLNLGYSFSFATYRLVANAGTVVSILNGPDAILPGSNGGSMTLRIGSSNPASPFVITTVPPAFTLMNVGGRLTVGNPVANPPGSYTGSFNITFIQE